MQPLAPVLRFVPVLLAAIALAMPAVARPLGDPPPNVLIVIADDLGVDLVGVYAEHPDPGHTPVIDSLAANGVLFRNAWAYPLCSTARAALLTGRHPFRTGIGEAIVYATSNVELSTSEVSLPDAIAPVYSSAIAGKWHMSSQAGSGLLHPLQLGFQHHWGHIEVIPGLYGNGYTSFTKSIDGVAVPVTTYATTDTVNDALTLMDQLPEPWMLWVSFSAPHSPFHKPPAGLHSFDLPATIPDNIPIHTKAAVEALDTELGRMLDSMDPDVRARTLVAFLGDNGTDALATTAPFLPSQAKKTVYEGGVNVPLIVSGPGVVAGAECTAPVSTTDLVATVVELSGQSMPTAVDSVSLLPYFSQPVQPALRDWVYTEFFAPNGLVPHNQWHRAVRNQRYKLIWIYRIQSSPTIFRALYDLQLDPFEQTNLLSGPLDPGPAASFNHLTDVMEGLQSTNSYNWVNLGFGLAVPGSTPLLTGTGPLLAFQPFSLTLTDALPSALAALILGATAINTPFLGGRLVPSPDEIIFVGTDAQGVISGSALWPPGIPSGVSVYFQFWIFDPAGPVGFSSSNGLAGTTP